MIGGIITDRGGGITPLVSEADEDFDVNEPEHIIGSQENSR